MKQRESASRLSWISRFDTGGSTRSLLSSHFSTTQRPRAARRYRYVRGERSSSAQKKVEPQSGVPRHREQRSFKIKNHAEASSPAKANRLFSFSSTSFSNLSTIPLFSSLKRCLNLPWDSSHSLRGCLFLGR